MASMANLFSTLLFLFFLVSPFQIHARDSQFFNKIPSKINSNNVVVLNKDQTTVAPQEQQQPSFMPKSENGGYGLYGRESTTQQKMTKMPSDSFEQSKDKYYTNGGNNYFNNQKASFPSATATTTSAVGGGDRYSSYNGGAQKQGMSDTRFMDNGRYYYGVNNGEKFPRNPLDNSRNEFENNRNSNGINNNNFMPNSFQEFEDEDDDLP